MNKLVRYHCEYMGKFVCQLLAVGVVIGKGGEMIKKIQGETGCKLQFIQGKGDGPGDRRCIISGTKQQVEDAKRTIEDLIESVMVRVISAKNKWSDSALRLYSFCMRTIPFVNSNGAVKIIKIAAARTRQIAIMAMVVTQIINHRGKRCRLRYPPPNAASSLDVVARPSN